MRLASVLLLTAQAANGYSTMHPNRPAPSAPGEITVNMCKEHINQAHTDSGVLYYSSPSRFIERSLEDLATRYPWYGALKILPQLFTPATFWHTYKTQLVDPLFPQSQRYIDAQKKFWADCGKALASQAKGTVFWLPDPSEHHRGLQTSYEDQCSNFAKFEFPTLCKNNEVTKFIRVVWPERWNGYKLGQEDITSHVKRLRDTNRCPPVQSSVHGEPQGLEG